MSARNLHSAAFDEGTITKLEVFENYLDSWLPVFIASDLFDSVAIWDFFAGPGIDKEGCSGSPARIVNILAKHQVGILQAKFNIDVHLNELRPRKFSSLTGFVDASREGAIRKLRELVTITPHRRDFKELFNEQIPKLHSQPNLIFIDQNGIKEVTPYVFEALAKLETTDFLFFVSSSSFRRFAQENAFRERFPDLDPDIVRRTAYADVHRIMLDYYRKKIPHGSDIRLFPFSIKKGSNIYGLIFGTRHLLGVDKFLRVAWDENKVNGEANFDIDGDVPGHERPFLPGMERLTKVQRFQGKLEALLADRGVLTNREICGFALENGHIPAHAGELVMRLGKEGKVKWEGRIGFSYNTCYKKDNVKPVRTVTNG